MINKRVVDYILREIRQGYTVEQISKILMKYGYKEDEVHEAFHIAHDELDKKPIKEHINDHVEKIKDTFSEQAQKLKDTHAELKKKTLSLFEEKADVVKDATLSSADTISSSYEYIMHNRALLFIKDNWHILVLLLGQVGRAPVYGIVDPVPIVRGVGIALIVVPRAVKRLVWVPHVDIEQE